MLTFIPAHTPQIPVLTKNVTVQDGYVRPRYNGPRVLPVLKRHGGQVRFVARPYLCSPPPMRTTLGVNFNSAAAAVTATDAASGGTTDG